MPCTPLHNAVTFVEVRTRIPTFDLSEFGFKVMRMCCLPNEPAHRSLRTLFEYQRRILNGATFSTRAGPLQLRSSSGCERYILNDSLMLRTSGCIRHTLKVACRLNVRCVLPQSRPRCMVDQPTSETVKVPIINVLLAFTDHPTPKTLGFARPSIAARTSRATTLATSLFSCATSWKPTTSSLSQFSRLRTFLPTTCKTLLLFKLCSRPMHLTCLKRLPQTRTPLVRTTP